MRERFSNDEWELLKRLPFAVLGMVAEAHGAIQLRELDKVVQQLDEGSHFHNELHRELIMDLLRSNAARLEELSTHMAEDDVSEVTSILHTQLDDAEYQSFVASLFVSGLSVAQGSGASEARVGEAEKHVLASFARVFELDPASIKPEAEKLRKKRHSGLSVSERLKRMPMLEYVTEKGLHRLVATGEVQTFEPGQSIIHEGDLGDTVSLVISGEAAAQKKIDRAKGTSMVVGKLSAGDMFGEMGLFEAVVRSADVVARTEVTTFSLHRSQFHALLEAEPAAAPSILRSVVVILSQRLRNAEAEMGVLYQLARIVGRTARLEELGKQVLTILMDDIPSATCGVLAVWPTHTEVANIVSHRNLTHGQVEQLTVHRKHPFAHEMHRHHESFTLSHLDSQHPLALLVEGHTDGNVVVASMIIDDVLRGFVALGCTAGHLTQSQERVVWMAASQVAATLGRLMEHPAATPA